MCPEPAIAPTRPRTAATTLGLGVDAGGTQTRWALADADSGEIVAEGHVAGLSGMQLGNEQGRAELVCSLQALAAAVLAIGRPSCVHAGITGLPENDMAGTTQMKALLSRALRLPTEAMVCRSDMDIAWRAAFAQPGEGYLLYAGTGAIAAFVDEQGQMQRAGGRGMLLGDEGGGYWIAREALARVWRLEDAAPGSAAESPMAQRLFAALGGSDWATTRACVYAGDAGSRGKVGQLALAVAASANDDPAATALLHTAGMQLGRLAQALLQRYGRRPIVASGRAWLLSPLVEQGLRESLPAATPLHLQQLHPHRAAALAAARSTLVTPE